MFQQQASQEQQRQEAIAEAKAVAEAGGDCVVVKLRQTYLTFYYGDRETGLGPRHGHSGAQQRQQSVYRKYA